jgi:hypothetical protein
MTGWLHRRQAALGPRGTAAAAAAVLLGLAAFATGLSADARPRAFAALIASWLAVAGVAAGAVAFRAIFRLIDARWARPLAALGDAPLAFAPVALALLAVILAGAHAAPWLVADPAGGWMSAPALAVRELAVAAALVAAGVALRRPGAARAVIYALTYAIALSVWAFDFVLGADATFESTLIGPYLFMAAFLAGAALVTLVALRRGALDAAGRRDAGALIVALSIFWAYLFWSQYLTIWYGNLPDEVAFALRRAEGGWGGVVLAVIGLCFAVPLAALLHPAGRRSPRVLTAVLIGELVGFWLDCQLLIVPSLTAPDAPALAARDLAIGLGVAGAFALAIAPRLSSALAPPASPGANPGSARGEPLPSERTSP